MSHKVGELRLLHAHGLACGGANLLLALLNSELLHAKLVVVFVLLLFQLQHGLDWVDFARTLGLGWSTAVAARGLLLAVGVAFVFVLVVVKWGTGDGKAFRHARLGCRKKALTRNLQGVGLSSLGFTLVLLRSHHFFLALTDLVQQLVGVRHVFGNAGEEESPAVLALERFGKDSK